MLERKVCYVGAEGLACGWMASRQPVSADLDNEQIRGTGRSWKGLGTGTSPGELRGRRRTPRREPVPGRGVCKARLEKEEPGHQA